MTDDGDRVLHRASAMTELYEVEAEINSAMTDDTPLQRAAKAIVDVSPKAGRRNEGDLRSSAVSQLFAEDIARAALDAALKVRWKGNNAYIGGLQVGYVEQSTSNPELWFACPEVIDPIFAALPLPLAQSAVERVVVEAILGEAI